MGAGAEGCPEPGERQGQGRSLPGAPQTQTPVQSWVARPHPGLAPAEALSSCLVSPPAGLGWADKELMSEGSKTELEPERKQTSQLLTRLYCWVPPPRGGCRVAPGPKLVWGRSRAGQPAHLRREQGDGGSGVVGSGLSAPLPPASGAAAGGSCLVSAGPWESSSSSGLQETSACYVISTQPLSCSWPLAAGPVGSVRRKAQIWERP